MWFSPSAPLKRALRAARNTPIAQVEDGAIAKVTGKVRCTGAPLIAPFSQRACGYYRLVIERLGGIASPVRWIEVIDEQRRVDFVLEDDTGIALVPSGDASVDAAFDVKPEPWLFKDVPASLAERIKATQLAPHGMVFDTALRCREAVFAVGGRVAVRAAWRREPALEPSGDDGGYRASPTWPVASAAGAEAIVMSSDWRTQK